MIEKEYKSYTIRNYKKIKQLSKLSKEDLKSIEVVGNVLPFKVNNYVIDELIDWDNYKDDPIFHLTFPQKNMLSKEHYNIVEKALNNLTSYEEIQNICNNIRTQLNPHPSGQQCLNVAMHNGQPMSGVQHKYRETVLFFPSSGQTCHAYCTFCFRWPQFVGGKKIKFASKESQDLASYLQDHHEVTDLLFTGGDPMTMSYKVFKKYFDPIWKVIGKTNIQTIRIGTKSLSFWPYRFVTDSDAQEMLGLFKMIVDKGINLAFMAHFNHPVELSTPIVKEAIKLILSTGAQIRTQSPIFKHINDDPDVWAELWRKQVNLNCIPYYMFIARDTGAKEYFELPLVEAYKIFREAYSKVSGICRTVRGPSMSCTSGKVMISGIAELNGEKVLALRFIQGRNPDWVAVPFFAKYDENASWMTDLKPAFSDKFFFENEMEEMYHLKNSDCEENKFE
jgi:KamA family protein